MKVHFIRKSQNSKIGAIPCTISSEDTCPYSCPLKNNGCYAEYGPLALHWKKVEERGLDWEAFCEEITKLPEGQAWRHNTAGDLPGDRYTIDMGMMFDLMKANRGKRGWTYTHYSPTLRINRAIIAHANAHGFTVNVSSDTLADADKVFSDGFPSVAIVPEDAPDTGLTPACFPYIVCPAQTGRAENCAKCMLCQKAKRKVIVAFRAHGTKKKAVSARSCA